MNKPTVTLEYDCSPAAWGYQMRKLEKRLDQALDAEAERIRRQNEQPQPAPAQSIVPTWWARMLGADNS